MSNFLKPYSESGERTESDEPKISISKIFLGMVYTLVVAHLDEITLKFLSRLLRPWGVNIHVPLRIHSCWIKISFLQTIRHKWHPFFQQCMLVNVPTSKVYFDRFHFYVHLPICAEIVNRCYRAQPSGESYLQCKAVCIWYPTKPCWIYFSW